MADEADDALVDNVEVVVVADKADDSSVTAVEVSYKQLTHPTNYNKGI